MWLGTLAHAVFSGRAQAAGYTNTITNRTMNAAVELYNSPGAFFASAITDREAASQALSRADLLIPDEAGVVHVFELKPEAQLANPQGQKAAAAQLDKYVKILNANGVEARPGDPKEFPDLFTGGEQTAGVVVGPGLTEKQTYNMIFSDDGTANGLVGYRLEPRATVETLSGEVYRGLSNQGAQGAFPVPGPPGWWIFE